MNYIGDINKLTTYNHERFAWTLAQKNQMNQIIQKMKKIILKKKT